MTPEPTVFVVDDDEALRQSLTRLMESVNLPVETYPDAQAFLDSHDSGRPGCLVLDIRMPGMNGLELQDKLAKGRVRIPIIIISAHGNVDKAVRAMKSGAVDFIKKPYKGELLLERIRQALELDARIRRQEAARAEVAARLALLSPREHEVIEMLAAGKTPKQIAFELDLSRKTVDVHRGHIMMKMRADTLVELVEMLHVYRNAPD
ncbi:MAG: response regulator transcription factor [Phycisphaerales bacterium]|nr:MAG: response regulator transcription factor [Phycisphaerales bacterium]